MKQKMISVVVPVYNCEKYLEECVDSILRQKYQNFEIILVDDGSTDASGDICDRYAQECECVKVIHKKNEGQQATRNAGIREAKGEYVAFVDSDDWIDEEMFEKMIDAIRDGDLVTSGIYRHGQSGEIIDQWMDLLPTGTYTKDDREFFENLIIAKNYNDGTVIGGITNNLVNKIFKTEIIKKMYEKANVHILLEEDFLFSLLYILECECITVTDNCFYHYRDHSQSMVHKANMNYLTERNIFYKTALKAIHGHWMEESLKNQLQKRVVYSVISGMNTYMDMGEESWIPTYVLPDIATFKGKKVVLFGAGVAGKSIFRQLRNDGDVCVVAWMDNFFAGSELFGEKLLAPNCVSELEYDLIVCGVLRETHYLEMKSQLMDFGVDEEIIIWQEPQNQWRNFFLH